MRDEEKKYLESYDIGRYERPSVATDIAIFSVLDEGKNDNFRKLQTKSLKVLLIKRASFPYKDCWALPGGFCRPDEEVYETARRELLEETNVKDAYLHLVDVFSDIGRDPRGWIMSQTFMALIDGEQCRLRAGSDAWEAEWFTVSLKENEIKSECSGEDVNIETEYEMSLKSMEKDIEIKAVIKENKQYKNYHEVVRYSVIESESLGFDHAKLILSSLITLRRMADKEIEIIFDLMPEQFTLTELQNVFELVLDRKLITANFRRKLTDYVIETDQIVEGAGFRPAKLFRRNVKEFYRL